MNEKISREVVYARSGGDCEVRYPRVCLGRATNWHHRRAAGRIWTPANGLHVCGSGTTGCHGWITHHPAMAREFGWTVSNYTDADVVHLVPVVIGDQLVFLHPRLARYIPVAPGLRAAYAGQA